MMKLTTIFRSTLLSGLLIGIVGCASDLNQQSALEIEQQTNIHSFPGSPVQIVSAPQLLVRHFQQSFYGYNTVYYNLAAYKGNPSANSTSYQLEFDANYGTGTSPMSLRHYDLAKTEEGKSVPTNQLIHETIRCQEFRDFGEGCLYRDRANVKLSLDELEAGRHAGINLTLSSAGKEYEHLYLSATYVDGFLRAVQSP